MKTKILLSIITFGIVLISYGQKPTIELTFTGQEETSSSYVSLDSLFIRNNTNGVDTMLISGDTVLQLNMVFGINESSHIFRPFELQQNYPNPFRDRTTFGISVFQKENLGISLYNIYGQKLTELNGVYETGTHIFTITGNQNKFYILNVKGQSHSSSIKIANSHPTGAFNHSIVYSGNQPIEAYYKVVMSKDGFPYTNGDELLFIGYAEGYEFSVLNDSPEISTDYTFPFDVYDPFVCGEPFTDKRDGKVYQTIKIDRQCWMTENMNIGEMISGSGQQQDNEEFEKYCYNDNENNCNNMGGLYQWDEMMQYDTVRSIQGVCPEGWHIPSVNEWNTLIDYYGGPTVSGDSLKPGGSSGFDALMAGYRNLSGGFSMLDQETYFWTSVYEDDNLAYYNSLEQSGAGISFGNIEKQHAYSVRCLKGLPIEVNENVVTVDTTIYTLISDSLELAQGIYKYEYNGKRKAKDIEIGDVIIGTTSHGYLRKVNMVTDEPPLLILETTQATMEDLFVQGDFSIEMDLEDIQKNNPGKITYLANGVDLKAKEGGWDVFFNNAMIYDDGNSAIYITNGSIKFHPNFQFDFMVEDSIVKKLAFYAESAFLQNSISLDISAQNVSLVIYDQILASYEASKIYSIGGKPVVVVTKIDLRALCSLSAETNFELLGGGYTNTNTISLGSEYENGEWSEIWDFQQQCTFYPFSFNGDVNLNQQLSLIPIVTMEFYGVPGPYFQTGLFERIIRNKSFDPVPDIDLRCDVGLDAIVGADVTIFGNTLTEFNKSLEGFYYPLWNMPYYLEEISGVGQSTNPNPSAIYHIKVKVTDNYGNALSNIPIPVHFEINTGGGSVIDDIVIIDGDGFAETYWTLGSVQGYNSLSARVMNADGIDIIGSPLDFNITTTTCTYNSITDPRDGKVYDTVGIGSQIWFAENLNYIVDTITGYDALDGWVYNSQAYGEIYGRLYHGSVRNSVCPPGWHTPSMNEFEILINYLGGEEVAGEKLKATGSTYWNDPNFATNESCFSALPGDWVAGQWYQNWDNFELGEVATFWSSHTWPSGGLNWIQLHDNYDYGNIIGWGSLNEENYHSVRCIKD